MKIKLLAAATVLAVAASAHADVSLLDASMYPTLAGTNAGTISGVSFASAAGNFILKSGGTPSVSGLGVTGGRTNDEIDIGETITMSWTGPLQITSFAIGMLYNGPEFADWAEIAQVQAWNGATLVATGLLQVDATNDTLAYFTGTGFGSVTNLSPATAAGGGGWRVDNPFGTAGVTKLEFTALASTLCGYGTPGAVGCTNQSDYVLSSVTAVPEPSGYLMALASLAGIGFVARRRRARR